MSNRSRSLDRSSDEEELADLRVLYDAYQMSPVYWTMEEYEPEDLNAYNVVVNANGIPIYVNSLQSFFDVYGALKGIFVLTMEGKLRMSHRKMHHSDLTAGHPVICAGEFVLSSEGVVQKLTNQSGHFLPHSDCLAEVVEVIRMNGYKGKIRQIDHTKSVSRKPIIQPFTFRKKPNTGGS